ncbi:hypothetical protein Tco_1151017 [Tanacetum coccineum]
MMGQSFASLVPTVAAAESAIGDFRLLHPSINLDPDNLRLSSMSPKDIVFTTKPFEYEAFVTSISDSNTVPSFEELQTKVLNQESRLHRIQAAQHSEQQSAFVSQTSALLYSFARETST